MYFSFCKFNWFIVAIKPMKKLFNSLVVSGLMRGLYFLVIISEIFLLVNLEDFQKKSLVHIGQEFQPFQKHAFSIFFFLVSCWKQKSNPFLTQKSNPLCVSFCNITISFGFVTLRLRVILVLRITKRNKRKVWSNILEFLLDINLQHFRILLRI